jgi:hypothetical protein
MTNVKTSGDTLLPIEKFKLFFVLTANVCSVTVIRTVTLSCSIQYIKTNLNRLRLNPPPASFTGISETASYNLKITYPYLFKKKIVLLTIQVLSNLIFHNKWLVKKCNAN